MKKQKEAKKQKKAKEKKEVYADPDPVLDSIYEKTRCDIQTNGTSCRTCFYAMQNVDWEYLCWLFYLIYRGSLTGEKAYFPIEMQEYIRQALHLPIKKH